MSRLCRVRKQSTLGVGEFFVRIFVLERSEKDLRQSGRADGTELSYG